MQKGQTKSEYVSIIFSQVLDKQKSSFCVSWGKCPETPVNATDLNKPPYKTLVTDFLGSEHDGTFFFSKTTPDGKREAVVAVAPPEWLRAILKSK